MTISFSSLLRQLISKSTIHPCSCYGTQEGHGYHGKAHSDLCKQRSWTGSCQGPAQAKYKTADELPLFKLLFRNIYNLSCHRLDIEPFEQLNGGEANQAGGADYPVQKETLEAEHFLNSEPRDDFCFGKYDPKQGSQDQVPEQACTALFFLSPIGRLAIFWQSTGCYF